MFCYRETAPGSVMSAWPTGVPWTTVGPPFIAVYGVVDEVIVPAPRVAIV